ncbi:MAG: hypothetical protein LBL34_05370, partial [Clostridiales bacterium]|nr:hypothetical protein [Clostridiales bacterium]
MKRVFSGFLGLIIFAGAALTAGSMSVAEAAYNFVAPSPIANPVTVSDKFYNFAMSDFAASTDSVVNQAVGSSLYLVDDAFWEYNAYNSHTVAFSTSLSTLSVVEYGLTTGYGQFTPQTNMYYYNHVQYITGLSENTTYHYRIHAKTQDGASLTSDDYTFTTRSMTADNVIRIPDDLQGAHYIEENGTQRVGPPYYLTQGGRKYVLTQNLTVPNGALVIKAHDVTIDLNGFTISYDNALPEVAQSFTYNERATYGIRVGLWNYNNANIYGGKIVQGSNNGAGEYGMGYNPISLNHDGGQIEGEIAGVSVEWGGDDINGINSGHAHVHHNVLYDKGTVISDRHLGIKAIVSGTSVDEPVRLEYNSVRRFRHVGVRGNFSVVRGNEMYSDSYDTNSFTFAGSDGQVIYENKIFGLGYLPIGIGWANDLEAYDNLIYIHGTALGEQRSLEYGRESSIAGIRYTIYGEGQEVENMNFHDNVVVLKAYSECTGASGLWLSSDPRSPGIQFNDNIVKVITLDPDMASDVSRAYTCVSFGGNRPAWGTVIDPLNPTIFRRNTFITNEVAVMFGTSYGGGGAGWFYDTKIVKHSQYSDNFMPVRMGWWYFNTMNHRMIDTVAENFVFDPDAQPLFFGRSTYAFEEDGEHHIIEEIRYGTSLNAQFVDQYGAPVSDANIIADIATDYRDEKILTDGGGNAEFDVLKVRHMKVYDETASDRDYQNDVIRRTYSESYTFRLAGYEDRTI